MIRSCCGSGVGSAKGCPGVELGSRTPRKRAMLATRIRAKQSRTIRDAASMFLSGSRQRLCGSGIAAARRGESHLRSRSAAGDAWNSLEGRLRQAVPALLLSGLSLTALPAAAAADSSTDDLNKLRTEIQKEIGALKKQEAKLHQQFLDLDRKSKLLDRKSELLDSQLRNLRAAGSAAASVVPAGVGAPGSTATISNSPPASAPPQPSVTEVAQSPASAPSAPAATGGQPATSPAGGESAPISGPLGSAATS